MIERSARNADYLDLPDVRSKLRARPVAAYLGARRGMVGYSLLIAVGVAAAVDAWRTVSPWLGIALALVATHALADLLVSWYRVASLPYVQAAERPADESEPSEDPRAKEDPSELP
ncbi:hypothetical protein HC028_15010 [Planosporangium flavigriseum]|uniref:Uncharacterized protein n=1 Tax=Planosporangium flavigriseum TaxID=373681 RepID=A0A8J3LMY7_9ACTN|nr:hypothetical protein [Planosporangium flavigriseum]NJC65801.1 hypothetical protein [Planosporangium flavigriseum]GIG73655.1 hypothetical protein Pfl04_20590 [Planosporangium flavigriseum]